MGQLLESVKKFFSDVEPEERTSAVEPKNVLNNLSDDGNAFVGSFFDETENGMSFSERESLLLKQSNKIKNYRKIAMEPDVSSAIESIVNEIIFTYDDKQPIQLIVNEENEALEKALSEAFAKVASVMNLKRNLYNIVRDGYVDGQLVLHIAYNVNKESDGIKEVNMIDPTFFHWDNATSKYMYSRTKDLGSVHYNRRVLDNEEKYKYDEEEIVREDFGIYSDFLISSYLEFGMKTANILQTLEDLLIPMRFSRSVSRRVFNVDIGDSAPKRGKEIMNEYQNKFKYKKFYNKDDGTISNQKHITSMVEDYWFSNRSGGRGTTVDTIDETGNLGELGDIEYFSKKLYRALKLPASRSPYSQDEASFDYDTSQTSQEDMEFFMFVTRLRTVYTSAIKEVLKREVVATGIMSEKEWKDKEQLIEVRFANESAFIEKMKLDNLLKKVEIFETLQEHKGKLFSVETILKEVFRYSTEEIEAEMNKIHVESASKIYANFYKEEY